MGIAEDWQTTLCHALDDLDVTILNPRRDEWDASWRQSITEERFREQVEARYRSDTRVEAYAEALGVSAKRLRLASIQAADVTPLRIVQDRLILEAKRLMLYSNMTVAEAAYYLGFQDPAYFTRFFTKHCGASPRKFRKASAA